MGLSRRTRGRIRVAAMIAIAIWVLAAALGGFRLISQLPGLVVADRAAEDAHRNSAWSPIYGFADVCQSRVAAGARVLLVDPTGAPSEVPVSQRTGPAAFGLPGDIDWPNQAVFAYVLYPRPVSALGHAPQDWPSVVGAAPYIAIWEQQSYRSRDAIAAGQKAEASLRSSLNAQEVCAFSSAGGDRGIIFSAPGAAVPTAAAAWTASGAAGGRAAAYARLLLGLASLWLTGFLLVRLVAGGSLPGSLGAAVALPLGCLAASLQLMVYSVLGVAWWGPALAAPWMVAAAVVIWKDRVAAVNRLRRLSIRSIPDAWHGFGARERVALGALAGLAFVITLTAPLGLPWSDGFNLYYFKARAFFGDGSVIPYHQHAAEMLFSFPAHPPLVPLSVTWLYLFQGQVDEHASLLLWPAFYISMLVGFYALLRTSLTRAAALCYTLAVALIGYELSTQALLASFADLPLAVYLLLACGSFWVWAGTERRSLSLLFLAGLCLGAATLTKEEGLIAVLVTLAATPLLLGRQVPSLSRLRWLPATIAFPVSAAIAVPWLGLRLAYHLPELTVHAGGVGMIASRLPAAVIGLGIRAAPPLLPLLAIAVAATLGGLSLAWLRSMSGRFYFLLFVVAAQLGADALAIAVAPVEVHHQVAIAASRLIGQVVPLAFLAFAPLSVTVIGWSALRARHHDDDAVPMQALAAPPL